MKNEAPIAAASMQYSIMFRAGKGGKKEEELKRRKGRGSKGEEGRGGEKLRDMKQTNQKFLTGRECL